MVSKDKVELLHKFLWVEYGERGKNIPVKELAMWMNRIFEINTDRSETFIGNVNRMIVEERLVRDEDPDTGFWVKPPYDAKDWVSIAKKKVKAWEEKQRE